MKKILFVFLLCCLNIPNVVAATEITMASGNYFIKDYVYKGDVLRCTYSELDGSYRFYVYNHHTGEATIDEGKGYQYDWPSEPLGSYFGSGSYSPPSCIIISSGVTYTGRGRRSIDTSYYDYKPTLEKAVTSVLPGYYLTATECLPAFQQKAVEVGYVVVSVDEEISSMFSPITCGWKKSAEGEGDYHGPDGTYRNCFNVNFSSTGTFQPNGEVKLLNSDNYSYQRVKVSGGGGGGAYTLNSRFTPFYKLR